MSDIVLTKNTDRALAKIAGKKLPDYLQDWELTQIFADHNKMKYPKAWMLALFLLNTGARISEAIKTKVSDIDFNGKIIILPNLKSSPDRRVVYLTPRLSNELISWIRAERLNHNDFLFKGQKSGKHYSRYSAYLAIQKLLVNSGIDKKRAHPHIFRHTYAIKLHRAGVPITAIRRALGHKSIFSTLIYSQLGDNEVMDEIKSKIGDGY